MTIAYVPPAAPAPQVEVAAQDCPRGSRDCFPGGLVGHRGSGRVDFDGPAVAWYRVQVVSYASGKPELIAFNTKVEVGGFFGDGLRDRLESVTAAEHPGLEMWDFWPLSSLPIAA